MGHDVEILNRGWNQSNSSLVYKIQRWLYYNVCCRRIYKFFNVPKRSKLIRSSKVLRDYVNQNGFNCLIVGSDQVWRVKNVRGADKNFFFDFVKDRNDIRKVSYAASFGVDYFDGNDDEQKEVYDLLNRFSHISVREDSGALLCKNLFNIESEVVLDPTFLLQAKDYLQCVGIDNVKESDTLATYILDESPEKSNFVKTIAQKKRLKISSLYSNRLFYKSVKEWIQTIAFSKFVIVDSFHGMVFCIIFKKQFYVIANKRRGNTRFENVLKMLGIENRLIYDILEINIPLEEQISYEEVNRNLDQEIKKSFSFLYKALT